MSVLSLTDIIPEQLPTDLIVDHQQQAKKLKDLEKENARLKKLVADLSLDNAILKEAAEGNF
jgi:cell division protein FtsB